MTASARLDPASAIPRYDLARQHLRHGRPGVALAALREVLEREPAHDRAQVELQPAQADECAQGGTVESGARVHHNMIT